MARIVWLTAVLVWVGCPGPRVDPSAPDPMVPAVSPPAEIPTQPVERGLELTLASVCETWVPSRPCAIEIELSWDGYRPLELIPMHGASPALAVSIAPAGKEPADVDWRTGTDAVERLMGFGAGEEPRPQSLSSGDGWKETRELSSFLSTPTPGSYQVFARYRDGSSEAFAQPRTLVVPEVSVESGHVAVDPRTHASLAVWNDGAHIWLMRGDARYPHGAHSFGEVEGIAGTVFAASPLTETPWIVGFAGGKWHAARLDTDGKVLARMAEIYTCQPCTPLAPLTEADGSLLLATRAPRGVLWHRVGKTGGEATALPQWSTPSGARAELGAAAGGIVSVSWVDSDKKVVGLIGTAGGKVPKKRTLARIKKGSVVSQRVVRIGRGGPEVWLASQNKGTVTAHLRSPHLSRDSKPLSTAKAPRLSDMSVSWHSGDATIYALDENRVVWSAFEGGAFASMTSSASGGFGLFGTATNGALWTADKKGGFRIGNQEFARMGFGMYAIGVLTSGEVPPQHEKARVRYDRGVELQIEQSYEVAGDEFLEAAGLWNQVPKKHPKRERMIQFVDAACRNAALSYISAGADSVLAFEAKRLKRSNKVCSKTLLKELGSLTK